MSELSEAELAALRKLLDHAECDPSFTDDEVEIIRNVVDAARSLLALGRLAKWAIFILASVAGGIAAYEQIKKWVLAWASGS